MENLKQGIDNLVEETTKEPTLEQSKDYLTNKGYNLEELGKENGFSNEFKRLNVSNFDDELLGHLNTYGKYLESQKSKPQTISDPINYEDLFDQHASSGGFKTQFEKEMKLRPTVNEITHGNHRFVRKNGLWDIYENNEYKGDTSIRDVADTIANNIRNQRLSTLTNEGLIDKAKKNIGTTWKYQVATYMLPDGSLLDGSDGTGGFRNDHRYIGQIYPELGFQYRGDYMEDFMKRGNIRLLPESESVELKSKPTPQQIANLVNYARKGYISSIETPDGDYYEEITPNQLKSILESL